MSCAITGTLTTTGHNRERDIVVGGKTLILTLTADTWVAAGATFNAERQGIIDGLVSAQAEDAGWNETVLAALAVGDVARTSDTVVTITLPAVPTYEITANETITVTVPATALTGGVAAVATPTVAVLADIAGYEELLVSSTAIALTPGSYLVRQSNQATLFKPTRAFITVETADVRWKVNPAVTLTAGAGGHVTADGTDPIELVGAHDIENFRVIAVAGDATIRVTYRY